MSDLGKENQSYAPIGMRCLHALLNRGISLSVVSTVFVMLLILPSKRNSHYPTGQPTTKGISDPMRKPISARTDSGGARNPGKKQKAQGVAEIAQR